MRLQFAILALLALPGCALFQPSREARSAKTIYADGELQPASLTAPRLATGSPVGLAPCKKKSFPARDCWRKGDEHVFFPPAASMADMPLSSGSVPVSAKR